MNSLYNCYAFLCYYSLTILSHYCHELFMSHLGVVRMLMQLSSATFHNTSQTGTVLLQMLLAHASEQNYQAGNKIIKSEKVWTCLFPVGSEESGHSISIKRGQKAWKFHSCLHSSSQLQNMTAQSLRLLAVFLFIASNWKGMRTSHFIHHFDGHTNETKLLFFGHS